MLPGEFQSAFGVPVAKRVLIPAFGTHSLGADADRYLFCVWATSGTVRILPGGVGTEDMDYYEFSTTSQPFMITHALHGALVNLPWRIVTDVAQAQVTIITGTMTPVNPRKAKVQHGTSVIQTSRNDRNRGKSTRDRG
jgi:hypothetical protein